MTERQVASSSQLATSTTPCKRSHEAQPSSSPTQGTEVEETDTVSNKKLRPDTTPEATSVDHPEFYIEQGLRRVRPYHFEHRTFAKGRWLGRTLLEVFSSEFRDRSPSYYENAIKSGIITLNGQRVTCDTIIRNSDLIAHKMHRHEPPVSAEDIQIIARTNDMLVVNKPASIPVHPTGRYHYNTVLGILEHEFGIKPLFPANRLDRLTSGLLLFSLNKHRARELELAFRERRIQKEYICRVLGEFPSHGRIVCREPIQVISNKLGLTAVRPIEEGGRECETEFERVSYNGRTSVVRCFPKTGRTHQIRVHLQHLGHPIANDPLYANPYVRQILASRSEQNNDTEQKPPPTPRTIALLLKNADERDEAVHAQATQHCDVCQQPLLPDPKSSELCIWLHAIAYSGETDQKPWRYEAPWPVWAAQDFEDDHEAIAAANAVPSPTSDTQT